MTLINRLQWNTNRVLQSEVKKENKMNEKLFSFGILVILSGGNCLDHYADFPDDNSWQRNRDSKLNKSIPYCYHFTWMGSKFNNYTFKNIRNKTCSQYFKDKKTLCINPMVATYKGGKPNITYILQNHANEATCRLSQEHVCVKYTVHHNGILSYETRYCSIINVEMEGPMQNGCIMEKRGSKLIEVCACKSQPGPDGICNLASGNSGAKPIFLTIISYIMYSLFLKD